ncbi:glycosyltransferase family 4 protein [Proteus cibi]|uniref:Glycosyltransferase family 4 protein n=1 Tax=Proteus cibi TaxID=2050966 RepID=A0ABU6EJ40_9GAMM|nr:glycosyltransferase family 4 protein [Proteus cibi]MEB6858735.1 glycosyltransferase family 4 protein [Proteus cibi]MEB7090190.1 glycosyltransferase family 4 protein [Proteus cibi]
MKIAIIGTTSASLLNFRKELIISLISLGHIVYCFSIDYTEKSKLEVSKLGAIPIEYQLSRAGLNPFSDIKNTYTLYKLLKKNDIDLSLSYFSKPAIFGTIAAKLACIPQIYAMLEGLGFCFTEQKTGLTLKTKFIKYIQVLLYKIALPLSDGLILLNKDDKKDLVERYKIKTDVFIWGGIGLDINQYKKSDIIINDKISFLFMGRLLKEKGIFEYIHAAEKIKNKYPNIEFIVLGDIDKDNPGSLTRKELDDLIEKKIITYPGHVDNVIDWLNKSHVFVLPSYREGLPRSTQEAMAIGRAIITTDVPGCRDTVYDKENGLLVKPWSSDELASKMEYLINNKSEIIRMGNKSHNYAKERFDQKITNEKILNYMKIRNKI